MKTWPLTLLSLGALQAFAIDKPVFGKREDIAAALGDVSERVEVTRAVLAEMNVERFKKDGWVVLVYFAKDRSSRVIISKENGAPLTDEEIKGFLTPFRANWEKWNIPNRRAWLNNVKAAWPKIALVTNGDKALELLDDDYIYELGKQTWLNSTEPKD